MKTNVLNISTIKVFIEFETTTHGVTANSSAINLHIFNDLDISNQNIMYMLDSTFHIINQSNINKSSQIQFEYSLKIQAFVKSKLQTFQMSFINYKINMN